MGIYNNDYFTHITHVTYPVPQVPKTSKTLVPKSSRRKKCAKSVPAATPGANAVSADSNCFFMVFGFQLDCHGLNGFFYGFYMI
jgi:hypothetical protein